MQDIPAQMNLMKFFERNVKLLLRKKGHERQLVS